MQPLYSFFKLLFIFSLNYILEYVSKGPKVHGVVVRTDCRNTKPVLDMLGACCSMNISVSYAFSRKILLFRQYYDFLKDHKCYAFRSTNVNSH